MASIDNTAPSRRIARPRPMTLLALLLLGAVAAVPAAMARSEQVMRAPSGIAYVTGGVGTEEVDRLKSMEPEFNLKLVFANPSGEYLGDVRVVIRDARGNALLDTLSAGPLLLAKLAPGTYRINADFEGQVKDRMVTVGADRLATVGFTWPSN